MTKTIIQTINAPVSGIVSAGDVTVDNLHIHNTVYTAPRASRSNIWWEVALVLLTTTALCGVALSQLPAAPTFSKPTVPMVSLESSAIAAIGHDPATHQLFVQFVHGKQQAYTYCGVPVDLYDGFLVAKSKGGYWHRWLWGGRYGC